MVVDSRDGLDGQITPATGDADLARLDLDRGHPLSGPIAVRGAEPGDVLKVEILAVETDGFGSTAVFPGFGLLGDLFEEPYLVTWGLHDGSATSGRLDGHTRSGRSVRGRDRRCALARADGAISRARSRAHRGRWRRAAAQCERRGARRRAVRVDGAADDPATRDRRQPRRPAGARGRDALPAGRRAGRAALARRRALRAGRRRGLRHRHRGARAGHPAGGRPARRQARASGRSLPPSSRSSRPGRGAAGTSSRPDCQSVPTAPTPTWTRRWRRATPCSR